MKEYRSHSVPRYMTWGVHYCALDILCRTVDAPRRIYVFTPWWGGYIGWGEWDGWRRYL